ncbi:MAG: hypothetical protein JEZ10_04225 [Verrucomicrobia bacterium]|nr:hypothetical protein [Verrucomicrobiota bacterium]
MTVQTLREFFMWCSIINFSLLMITFAMCAFAADWIYKMHSKWFSISRVAFNTILYSFLGIFKVLVLVLNIVPWIALSLIA